MENLVWPFQIIILNHRNIKIIFHYHSVDYEGWKHRYGWKLKIFFSTYFFSTSFQFQSKMSSKTQVPQNAAGFASEVELFARSKWFWILRFMSFITIILEWSHELSIITAGVIHLCCCFFRQQNFRLQFVDKWWCTQLWKDFSMISFTETAMKMQ